MNTCFCVGEEGNVSRERISWEAPSLLSRKFPHDVSTFCTFWKMRPHMEFVLRAEKHDTNFNHTIEVEVRQWGGGDEGEGESKFELQVNHRENCLLHPGRCCPLLVAWQNSNVKPVIIMVSHLLTVVVFIIVLLLRILTQPTFWHIVLLLLGERVSHHE